MSTSGWFLMRALLRVWSDHVSVLLSHIRGVESRAVEQRAVEDAFTFITVLRDCAPDLDHLSVSVTSFRRRTTQY